MCVCIYGNTNMMKLKHSVSSKYSQKVDKIIIKRCLTPTVVKYEVAESILIYKKGNTNHTKMTVVWEKVGCDTGLSLVLRSFGYYV